MPRTADEATAFWRHPRFADLALLTARFTRHRYALHTHPTYVIALVTEGCERLRVGRHAVVAPAGSLILVNPEECHDGEPGAEGGWAYRTFYPSVALMGAVAAETGRRDLPLFAAPLLRDPALARAVALAHEAAARDDAATAEATMLQALRALILRHAAAAPRREAVERGGSRRRVALYAELVEDALAEDIRLDRLAAAAGVTRFQVIRDMRRELGLTPGAFIRTHRLRRAARLIAAGEGLAAAANAAGFADQSHLTRAFRTVHGVTPRAWQRAALASTG
jgi:AraC-like DNA-binding protein